MPPGPRGRRTRRRAAPPALAVTSVAVEVHRGLPDPMADSKVDTVAETAVDTIVLDFSDRFGAVKPRHGAMVHLAAERPAATMQLAATVHLGARRPAARRTLAIPAAGHVFAPYIKPPN